MYEYIYIYTYRKENIFNLRTSFFIRFIAVSTNDNRIRIIKKRSIQLWGSESQYMKVGCSINPRVSPAPKRRIDVSKNSKLITTCTEPTYIDVYKMQ